MTVKEFFKGKAFKCIIVLMCILLISGILLSVCWGFLEVTDEERFNRKIGSVYGGETVTAEAQDISDKNTSVSDAKIQSVWLIKEKNDYLVQAASRGNGGDVTCWIAINMDESLKTVTGIEKVLVYSVADAAEYVMNIGEEIYEKFVTEYEDGKVFEYGTKGSDQFIATNATFTMTAICNCVNGSVSFIKAYAGGGTIVDPLEGFSHKDYINGDKTTWTVDGTAVKYSIVTKGIAPAGAFTITLTVDSDKAVKNYTIVTNGSTNGQYETSMSEQAKNLNGKTLEDVLGFLGATGDDNVLHTGATLSNSQCHYAAAFALANYDKCQASPKGGN